MTGAAKPDPTVIQWLLHSDPAIRWQVMRDVLEAPAEEVTLERARVATEGFGAALLARQRPDGNFGDGVKIQHWRANLFTLLLLRSLGIDPMSEPARKAIGLVREQVNWGPEWGHSPFFEGEGEPCINGGVLALGSYFGEASDRLADRLLSEQLQDGGWNCEAERGSVRSSFHTTICALEGLLEYERARGANAALTAARLRGHEYLLERHLFRRLSTGEAIQPTKSGKPMPSWTSFTFPPTWQYDILRGLEYLRTAGVALDERMTDAVRIVADRRQTDGRWLLDQAARDDFDDVLGERPGEPSRWNTLRALRVLEWSAALAQSPVSTSAIRTRR